MTYLRDYPLTSQFLAVLDHCGAPMCLSENVLFFFSLGQLISDLWTEESRRRQGITATLLVHVTEVRRASVTSFTGVISVTGVTGATSVTWVTGSARSTM